MSHPNASVGFWGFLVGFCSREGRAIASTGGGKAACSEASAVGLLVAGKQDSWCGIDDEGVAVGLGKSHQSVGGGGHQMLPFQHRPQDVDRVAHVSIPARTRCNICEGVETKVRNGQGIGSWAWTRDVAAGAE